MLARYASVIHLPSQQALRCFWGIPKPLNYYLKTGSKHEQKKKKFSRFLA